MKKKLLLAPLMAALVACVVLLSGCGGPSVEELITNDLTSQFDEIKNGGDDFLSGLEEASGDEFEQLGIDPKEYAKSYLEGFDYKIGDVTVDEDKGTATAEVTITCKSMNKIVEDFATQYQEKIAALDTMPSEEDLYKMAGQVMVDVTKAAKTKDTKVTFKYSANEDNEWSADDSATTERMNAMMSQGITRFYEPRNQLTLQTPLSGNLTFNFKRATRRSAPFHFTSPCSLRGVFAVRPLPAALPW